MLTLIQRWNLLKAGGFSALKMNKESVGGHCRPKMLVITGKEELGCWLTFKGSGGFGFGLRIEMLGFEWRE